MADHTRLLEDRVRQAVERLRSLAAERDRLQEEVRELRRRLDESDRALARFEEGAETADSWTVERARVVSELRQTLHELRGE